MNSYKILEAVGEGSFGRVFRGECLKTRGIVALKFIPKRNKIDRELKSLRRECEIQQELFHPNIVRMIDAFETDREVVAVSEYVPIQLFSLLEKHGTLPEYKVRGIACNLISAIYYLHSLRILHRDIKPQNILLTETGEAKLCDFGFSRKMGINTYVLTSIKGTPLYMAPELIDESPYDHTADLWSLGCILFELLTGKPPFCTTSIVQLIKMVHLESVRWPNNLSENCRTFLEGLLQKEPSQRLTWPRLLEHPWVKDGVLVLESSIDPSPLTCPLSSSQQQIKELQKKQLLQQAMSQPKILKTLSKNCFLNSKLNGYTYTPLIPSSNNIEKNGKGISKDAPKILNENAVEQRLLTSERDNLKKGIQMKTFSYTEVAAEAYHNSCVPLDVDVRAALGSSVRKLSTVSQESGFKDEDVADFTSRGHVSGENRKDSMINYLSNSIDSSRRGSRPSFPTLDTGLNNGNYSTLPNINEESVGNLSSAVLVQNDLCCLTEFTDKEIEKEEWARFLDTTLSEIVGGGNYDIFSEQTELSLFISPLQNVTCPLIVIDKIAILLMMPFAIEQNNLNLSEIVRVYLECKVVPNLIYKCKLILNSKLKIDSAKLEFDKNTIKILKSLVSLTCFLIHSDKNFIIQFCDAVCILSSYKTLEYLIIYDIQADITEKVIAILNQILRQSAENVSVVEQILPSSNSICHIFEQLLNHPSNGVRAAACTLIGYSAVCSCSYLSCLQDQHGVICDLINLENDVHTEVQRAATFAVSCLQCFTSLIGDS